MGTIHKSGFDALYNDHRWHVEPLRTDDAHYLRDSVLLYPEPSFIYWREIRMCDKPGHLLTFTCAGCGEQDWKMKLFSRGSSSQGEITAFDGVFCSDRCFVEYHMPQYPWGHDGNG